MKARLSSSGKVGFFKSDVTTIGAVSQFSNADKSTTLENPSNIKLPRNQSPEQPSVFYQGDSAFGTAGLSEEN